MHTHSMEKYTMTKVVTLSQTPTETILRWVDDRQVLVLKGRVPDVWLDIMRNQGYTIQHSAAETSRRGDAPWPMTDPCA
jgi:hypothetical protein